MALLLQDFFTPLTQEQLKATAYTTLGKLKFPVTNWRSGGIGRTIVALFAALLAPTTELQVRANKSKFLDYAQLDTADTDPATPELQLLAHQEFGVDLIQASFAEGSLTLNNTAGGVFSFGPFEAIFAKSSTGKTYSNTAAFALGSMQTGLVVPIQALEAGSNSSAAATEIDTITTTMTGVTCSNTLALVGTDLETNQALISRCRAKTGSLSPMGPGAAYDFVARTPSLVNGQVITRTNVVGNSMDGTVAVYIADASGGVASPIITDVQAGIDKWARPICIEPTVYTANNVPVPVTYTAYVLSSSSITQAQLQAAAQTALENYFANSPIGGWVISGVGKIFQNAIESIIKTSVIAGAVAQVVVSAPSGDTVLGTDEVAVLGLVTPTVVFI